MSFAVGKIRKLRGAYFSYINYTCFYYTIGLQAPESFFENV